jgi:hypothetical protein
VSSRRNETLHNLAYNLFQRTGKVYCGVVTLNYFCYSPGLDFFTILCNEILHNTSLGTTKYIFTQQISKDIQSLVIKNSKEKLLTSEIFAHSNYMDPKNKLLKGIDWRNFQFYHSIPLFIKYKLPESQLKFWYFFTDTLKRLHDRKPENAVSFLELEKMIEEYYHQMSQYKNIFNNNKITPKLHALEHNLTQFAKFGSPRSISAVYGEHALNKMKKSTSKSHRTMIPAVINFCILKSQLSFFIKFAENPFLCQKINTTEEKLVYKDIDELIKINKENKSTPKGFKEGKIYLKNQNLESLKRFKINNGVVTVYDHNKLNCFVRFLENEKYKYGILIAISKNKFYFKIGNEFENFKGKEYGLIKISFHGHQFINKNYEDIKDSIEKVIAYKDHSNYFIQIPIY